MVVSTLINTFKPQSDNRSSSSNAKSGTNATACQIESNPK